MPHHDIDDDWDDVDEDWTDDDDDPHDDEPVPCPECRRPIPSFLDKCPACGYWLSAADRRRLKPGETTPVWVKATATIVLITLVVGLLLAFF